MIIKYAQLITTALAYYYFNRRYFMLVTISLRLPLHKGFVAATFIINYALFFVCSMLELNLIINWTFFFIFLYVETILCCQRQWLNALYFSLLGIICGLSINIFFRCAEAIAINQPLSAFDNNISSVANYKAVPIFLGFLLGGITFRHMSATRQIDKLQKLVKYPQHMSFQLELMGGMFLYLFLNLLLYQSNNNGIMLKLWGIKSCLFSSTGYYLGMRYSLTMCQLSEYKEHNRIISQEIAGKELEENNLRSIAYRDTLTGAYNRQYAIETITKLLSQDHRFSLCFVDLDRLKEVNDICGHSGGDYYLTTVASQLSCACRQDRDMLFRYGGDEFLLLLTDTSITTAAERLQFVNSQLKSMQLKPCHIPMSISYGIVESSDARNVRELIHAADNNMYKHKKAKRKSEGGRFQ